MERDYSARGSAHRRRSVDRPESGDCDQEEARASADRAVQVLVRWPMNGGTAAGDRRIAQNEIPLAAGFRVADVGALTDARL